MIFLCIFPLFSFFWPHASFSDIIIYIPTHIREELCEAALKSDSAAVHDGTRRRILIVAHRCVCVLIDGFICVNYLHTCLFGGRTVTTAHNVRLYLPIVFLSCSCLFDEAVSWVCIDVCNYREGIRELSEVSDGAKISHTPYCCVATFRYATVSLTASFRACILNSQVTVSSRACMLK